MKFKDRHIVPSSALGYAIAFLMLVGLFTSGVLFLASTHKRIETHFTGQEYLLFNNHSGLLFGAQVNDPGSYTLYHPSGDTSIIQVKPWGFMKSTVVSTFNKHRRVRREALTMQDTDASHPCLYMPNQKRKIALAGETRLEGNVYASERSLTRANINRKPLKSEKLIYGKLIESERHLPPLHKGIIENDLSSLFGNVTQLEALPEDSSFSFSNKTSLYRQNEAMHIAQKVSGNLVLQSSDEIFIKSDAELEHVILLAPSVIFERGFQGKVQVIANRMIVCEEDVKLDYPSALLLHETGIPGQQSRITLMENSRVLGGILLTSKKPDFRNPMFLEVLDATVGGLIYNQGETEFRGELIGSLYTNKLVAHASGGVHGGHLVDARLSSEQLPAEFIYPNWLRDSRPTKPILITCL